MTVAFNSDVTLEVRAAFGDTFGTVGPTWTDISDYVRSFTVRRGRSHELDQIRPGALTMVLDNRDGRFDPSYTSGAYYPDVKLNVPVSVRAVHNSITYDLFYGFSDGWTLNYPGQTDSTATLEATDGFKMLARAASTTAQSAEQSDSRIGQLLNDAGWPAAVRRALETGDIWCIDWTPPSDGSVVAVRQSSGAYMVRGGGTIIDYYAEGSASVLSLIRQVEQTEGGVVFVAANGDFTFHNRYYRSLSSSQATYGDSGSELKYSQVTVGFDDTQLWNRVRVTSALDGAVTQSASDTTSITDNGLRTMTLSNLLLSSDNHSAGLALWLRDRWSDPQLYVHGMTVRPQRDPSALWPRVLGDDISTKLTVRRRPAAGNTIEVDVFVDGITHTVTPKSWTTTYFLSNAEGVYDDYLLLDDATDGLLDTNKLGY